MSITTKKLTCVQEKFGNRLKELRAKKGLSQLDLATKCDLEKTSISRIENGRTNFTLKTALILAEALEISMKELFDY